MIPLFLCRRFTGIRVHQSTERPPIDDQPGNERTELRGGKKIDLEHRNGMRSNRPIEESVDTQFGDYDRVSGQESNKQREYRLHSRRIRSQSALA